MKKLIAIIAVVALAAPLYAAEVTVTASDAGDGKLQIGITSTGPSDPNVPIGISFVVSLSDGANIGVDPNVAVLSTDPTYNVYIDAAFELGSSWTLGASHPLAHTDQAGFPDPNASSFSVSMGRLDPAPHSALNIPNLLTIQLLQGAGAEAECGSTSFNVTIQDDTLRGGNVGAGGKVLDTF